MIETERAKDNFSECNSCRSTDDVYILKIGLDNKTCIKLCNECRGDIINILKEITDSY